MLPKAELKGDGKSEYYICADIARSTKTSNNQTSISVGKVKRDKNEKVKKVQLVNLINLPHHVLGVRYVNELYVPIFICFKFMDDVSDSNRRLTPFIKYELPLF